MNHRKFNILAIMIVVYFIILIVAWASEEIKERWFEWIAGIYMAGVLIFALVNRKK